VKCCYLLMVATVSWSAPVDVGQPVPFSHKQHAERASLKCSDCHKLAPSGEVYSIPNAKFCMTCHTAVAKGRDAIKELKSYADDNETVPWVRVYEIPSFVDFSHKVHADAGTKCEVCHGNVSQRDRLTREADLSMAGCVSCHVQHGATTGCHTCHDLDE
jgi:hypothetical protein